jgi:branched-chain amino acid transport system permease protein
MALVVAVAAAGSMGTETLQRQTTGMLINLTVVVGLYIFSGTSGVLSFGHISFMAIGAYITALVTIPVAAKATLLPDLPAVLADAELPTIPATLLAGLAAAVVAAALAVPIMRLAGITASLATFAFLLIAHDVIQNWEAVTRGLRTLFNIPANTTLTSALLWSLAAIAIAYVFQESRSGLRLRASREDETAARAAGVDVVRERQIAFVISAFVVGVAGHQYAQFYSTLSADAFYVNVTFITIAMLVVGGLKSLLGAVSGTIFVSAMLEVFRQLEESGAAVGPVAIGGRPGLRELAIASLLVAVLMLRPKGLVAGREASLSTLRDLRERVLDRRRTEDAA